MESSPPRTERLEWLQVARAFAAFYVVSYHAAGRVESIKGSFALEQIFRFGNAGVDLFFVISGFIIFYVHAADVGKPKAIGAYIYKRATQIYPPFWVLCACVLPLYFVFPDTGEPFARDLSHVLANIFLVPIQPHPIITISWTLIAEMIFYVAFCAMILNARFGKIFFVAWIGCWIVHRFITPIPGGYYVGQLLAKDFIDFFGGMAVAYCARRFDLIRPAPWLALGGLAVTFLAPQIVIGAAHPDRDPMSLEICYTISCMAIVAGAVGLSRSTTKPPRFLIELGAATYSVYLFHWVVGWVIEQLKVKLWPLVALPSPLFHAVMIGMMLAAGYGAYIIVERPLLRLTSALWSRLSWPALGGRRA